MIRVVAALVVGGVIGYLIGAGAHETTDRAQREPVVVEPPRQPATRPATNASVASDAETAPAIRADVRFADGTVPATARIRFQSTAHGHADRKWSAEEPRVAPPRDGTYAVYAETAGGESTPQRIVLPATDTITLVLKKIPSLRALVRFPPGSTPSGHVLVRVSPVDRPEESDPLLREPDGSYVRNNVRAGRYRVTATFYRAVLAAAEIEVGGQLATVTLDVFDFPPERWIAARVLEPGGKPCAAPLFMVGSGERADQRGGIRRADGAWLVPIPERKRASSMFVFAKALDLAPSLPVPFTPGRTEILALRLRAPAFLNVTVSGYAVSTLRDRLRVQVGEAFCGLTAAGDGRIGPLAPGEYELFMTVYPNGLRCPSRRITLSAGENRLELPLPGLHTLTVAVPPGVKSVSVGGRGAVVRNGIAVIEELPTGRYRLRALRAKTLDVDLTGDLTVNLQPD